MISFRTREDATATTISVLAIIILAASLVLMLTPVPTREQMNAGKTKSALTIQQAIETGDKSVAASEAAISPLIWSESSEEIGPRAMAAITRLAQTRKLRILAFRPQKPIEMEGLTQIPFSLSVDGSYPNTMQFVKDLETSKTKLAVSLVQIAASDAASDQVTGTINVIAYLKAAQPTATRSAPRQQPNAQKP